MSKPKILDLIKNAPVEWLTLGELGTITRGNGLQKKDFKKSGFPAIHYGQIYTHYNLDAKDTIAFVSEDLAKRLRTARKNDLLFATTSETDEDVVKPLAWLGDDVAISGDMMFLRHEQNVKYLAYYFQTNAFYNQKRKHITGTKVRRISRDNLGKIHIPIPSLDIQKEIVRILDTMTALNSELSSELNSELTRRQTQYDHYRELLLTFTPNQTIWKSLNEVAIIGTGNRNTNEAIAGGKYPFYVRSQMIRQINNYEFDEEAIITAGDGVGVGKIFHYATGKYNLHQRAYRIVVADTQILSSKFLYYFFASNFYQYIAKTSVHASVTSLRKPMFENYQIPLPSLEEQTRIVAILDKFDALTTSIREDLSREIELRRKQYEYYRELLLDFPRPEQQSLSS
ncbi:MAG: restriction endonuclease subunit S [Castellaniella sp.]